MRNFNMELYFVAIQHEHRNIGEALPWYSHQVVAGPFISNELATAESVHHVAAAADQHGELVIVSGGIKLTDFGVY